MPTSQNGYSANDRSKIKTYTVAGEPLPMREGPTGQLLAEVAEWVHKNVESISKGHQADDWGYAERPIRGSSTTLSNHASGTAFDFNATQHPLGVTGTWSRKQKRKVNWFLRNKCNHTVRWGENYSGRKDGMHFEINDSLDDVRAALREVRGDARAKRRNRVHTVDLGNVREQFRRGGPDALPGVKTVQRELNARGAELAVDGHAGPSTRDAYRRFERSIPGKVGNNDGIPGWFSLRVLGGLIPLPQRQRFKVRR